MDIEVVGTDEWGNESYKKLFDTIMNDAGKSVMVEKAKLVLMPAIPLFIFSVRLRAKPESKKISDAASFRSEGGDVHLSISDERYAPEILSQLWKIYGRANVIQNTRFDLVVNGGDEARISDIEVSSSEEMKKDFIGAIWRAMPEGIKARHNISQDNVITIAATEEIFTAEFKEEAAKVHAEMLAGGSADV